MTRKEFKERWESNDDGGEITFNDIADCAKAWCLCSSPKTMEMFKVRYMVLKAAKTIDAEDFAPQNEK